MRRYRFARDFNLREEFLRVFAKAAAADVQLPKKFRVSEGGVYVNVHYGEAAYVHSVYACVNPNRTIDEVMNELVSKYNIAARAAAQKAAEKHAKLAEQKTRFEALNKEKLEFLSKLGLLTSDAEGQPTMPSGVKVADLFNLRIESLDVKAGTVSLYTQTDVDLKVLTELIRRSSNISFDGVQVLR